MRSTKTIHVVSCHAEGEVGDVIVGGVAPPPGDTIWEQRNWIARDQTLRNFMLNEPRGGVFRHVNLLVPAETSRTRRWAGSSWSPSTRRPCPAPTRSASSTVLLDSGIIPMTEPVTHMVLEAPGGLVRVRADCADGKAQRIHVRNLPSFAAEQGVRLDVPGHGEITVDTAYGGDSFVIVDGAALGVEFVPGEARKLAELGVRITDAANRQLSFHHPDNPDWRHFSFCLFAGPLSERDGRLTAPSAVAIQPGKIDRSPTGTAVSARMALLHAQGRMAVGDRLRATSLIGSTFDGLIVEETQVAGRPAIIPEISGRAWITGTHQHMLDPDDPWPEGYRLSDTWPRYGAP